MVFTRQSNKNNKVNQMSTKQTTQTTQKRAPRPERKVTEGPDPVKLKGSEVPLTGPLAKAGFNFDDIRRKHFTNAFLSAYTSSDLLFMFQNIKFEHDQLRASGSPGSEGPKAAALAKLNELRAILQRIGHKV